MRTREDANQSRLPRSVLADERVDLALPKIERHAPQRAHTTEGLREAVEREHRRDRAVQRTCETALRSTEPSVSEAARAVILIRPVAAVALTIARTRLWNARRLSPW